MYDNTGCLSAGSWRHVAFIEQRVTHDAGPQTGGGMRWLMASDVCKHCAQAGCLDVCPTGALMRTEFGTVVVQEDICNGCGYCVPACPFGVIDRRETDGRAWKCTLCYDRLRGDLEPACAQACPTKSIQFGQIDELRAIADERVRTLHERGAADARLYGADPGDGVGGFGAFFLLLDEPEVYGLPPDPVVPTRNLRSMWGAAAAAALAMAAGVAAAALERAVPERAMVPRATPTSYYGHPVLKPPVWTPEVGIYLFTGGLAGGSAVLAAAARAQGNDALARRALWGALAGAAASPALLIKDLGVPRRFHHMLRVAKPTSPMSVGTWILSAAGTAIGVAAACDTLGVLRGVGRAAEAGAALLGPALSTYTAVLLADTAVPAWHGARHELPFLFAASAAASAGAAATMITPPAHARLARTVTLGGVAAELAAAEVVERRLGELGEPYHRGDAGRFGRAAQALGLVGAGLLGPGTASRGRRRRRTALLAASLCERFSVFQAGTISARDPRYTVGPQRSRAR